MNEWVLLAIGVLLTVGTGVFVGSEFSLVNLDRAELEAREQRGERGLGSIIQALRTTSTQLSSAQLGITLTTLLTGYTMEPAITTILSGTLRSVGIADDLIRPVGAGVALIVATVLSMVFGELMPKNFALALPLPTAKLLVPVQLGFTFVFKPAVVGLNSSANWVIRRFGIEPQEELSGARSAEELMSLVRRSALEGVLESDRAVLLSRTLRFSSHTAADVMTPRPRLSVVDVDAPVEAVLELVRTTGHSRFPVIREDIDDVAGIVHVKDVVSVPLERRPLVPVGAVMKPALLVPETVGLDVLLGDLRGKGYQLAIVLDEYGGTSGVATLEDLVEEIVGDLVDEHDRKRVDIDRVQDRYVFDGLLRPDELRERLAIDVPEEGPYETIGGFLMNALARVPRVGDEVELENGTLRVAKMDGRRVDRVEFTPGEGFVTREELLARAVRERADAEEAERRETGRPAAEEGGERG